MKKHTIKSFLTALLLISILPALAFGFEISSGHTSGAPGATSVTVPIRISNVGAALSVDAIGMTLTYNSAVLTYKSVDKTDTLLSGLTLLSGQENTLGQVKISGALFGSTIAIDGDGVLINVVFDVKASAYQNSNLSLSAFKDDIAAATTNLGTFSVTGVDISVVLTPESNTSVVAGQAITMKAEVQVNGNKLTLDNVNQVDFATSGNGVIGAKAINAGTITVDYTTSNTVESVTVTATEKVSGNNGTDTSTITSVAGPATAVAVDSGDNQSGVVGSNLTLAVIVTDANGNAVSGADVAFAVTTAPANGAALSSASVTTGADGKAEVTLTLGTVSQNYTTTATVGAIAPVTFTSTATPGPLAAYDVAYTAFDGTAGVVNSITVKAQDAKGNTITTHTGTASFTATDPAATLPADYSFVAGDNGVKTFNVTLTTAGAQTVTVTTGTVTGTVDGTVIAAAASKIDLQTSATTIASDGVGTATLTATVQDQYNNVATTTAGDITFTVTGAGTANVAWATNTKTLAKGVAVIDLKTSPGSVGGTGSVDIAVDATLAPLTKGTIAKITIIDFSILPATSYKAVGDTIAFSVEGAQGTVDWAVTGDAGVGTLGSFTGTNKDKAVFTLTGPGNATITVTQGGNQAVATVTAYGPLASYKMAYKAFDGTAGVANTITVTAIDVNGNTVTNHGGKVVFTSSDPLAVLPAEYTFLPGDAGVKDFVVTLKTAGKQTVTATTGDVSKGLDGTVVAAAAAKVDLKTSATVVASGGIGTAKLTVTIQDAFDNTVTAAAGNASYTLTGAGVTNAQLASKSVVLKDGVAETTLTTKGTVPAPGTTTVDVTAGLGALTSDKVTLTIVNFSVTPAASTAAIGDTINLSVEGAQGKVTWVVSGDAGVGSLGSFSGTNDEKAVFTVAKEGNATITVSEGAKSSVATIAAHDDVVITDLPSDTVTVLPGAASAEFAVTGGDGTYTWSVAGPSIVAGATAAAYTFTAPKTGNFAGEYTVTVTDSVNTNSKSFKIYVPLIIDPDDTKISVMSNAAPFMFTITGAANDTPYKVIVDSLDDAQTYTPVTAVFNAQSTATYAFDPKDYMVTADTGNKDYSLEFEVQGLIDPPMVDMTIVPVTEKTFAGIITEPGGGPVSGAMVTIIAPAGVTQPPEITAADGSFAFTKIPTVESSKFGFKAEKAGHVTEYFDSSILGDDGLTQIEMSLAAAVISGSVTNSVGEVSSMTLFGENGKVAGPIDSDIGGVFRFVFETAPSVPVSYIIKAAGPGFSGFTSVTAESFDYTGISFAMDPIKPVDSTVTKPAANGFVDASAGGKVELLPADVAALDAETIAAFGTNAIKLVISPVKDGKVVVVALPESKVYKDKNVPITSGTKWEIDGLGDNCVTIPVPCNLADAMAVGNKTKTIWFENSDNPGVWNSVIVDPINIFYNGDNSLIEVEICDWSANVVGIGNVQLSGDGDPSILDSLGGDVDVTDDDSICFIGSLSATGTNNHMTALISMMAILAAGILIAVIRRQKTN